MIDPRNLTLQQWSDATILSLGSGWEFARYAGGDWQNYLVSFVRAPSMAQRVLPDPHQFSDWREWAMRAAPMLGDAG